MTQPNESAQFWETLGYKPMDVNNLVEGEVFLLEHGSKREACRFVRIGDTEMQCVPVPRYLLPQLPKVLVVDRELDLEELQ